MVAVAEVAAVDHPELVNLIPPAPRQPLQRRVSVARQKHAGAASAQKDVLIATGLGETVFDDLQAAITQFEADTDAASAGKLVHIGAAGQLKEIVKECNREVRIIGTYMTATYADNQEVLTAWASARKVISTNRKPVAVEEPSPEPVQEQAVVSAPAQQSSPSDGQSQRKFGR